MSGGRLKVALVVAAAFAAAVVIVHSVDRPDAPKSETPAEANSRAAATANRPDPDVVAARGAADSRLAHAPFVEASPEAEPGSESDAESRPTPPPDARRIVVEAVFEDGDPVVGCVVEALPVAAGDSRRTTEQGSRTAKPSPRWRYWDDHHLQSRLDERGRAELFVPPDGRFLVRSPPDGYASGLRPDAWPENVRFLSEVVATDARTVRIVVPAATLSMTVRDQHGRPISGRPYVFKDRETSHLSVKRTDENGRIRWHRGAPGSVVVRDYGRRAPVRMHSDRGNPPIMKPRFDGRYVGESPGYAYDEILVDGVGVETGYLHEFDARAPSEVVVRMRSIPVAIVRVVDADDRPVRHAHVVVDAGFAGRPFRKTLDEGLTDVAGTASVEVACDGRSLAVDASLSNLRWRVRSPTGREERTVDVPLSSISTLVDAGTVKLATHRTWKVRFVAEGGTVGLIGGATFATIPHEGAPPELENRDAGMGRWDFDGDTHLVYPRIEDALLRVRREEAPHEYCDIRIDRDAASVEGPGQLVACTTWRTPAEPFVSPEPGPFPFVPSRRNKLVVRVESAAGVAIPHVDVDCSSNHETATTDVLGNAEFRIDLGPGRVGVRSGQPFHAELPWDVEYDAKESETHVILRARPLREIVVRTSPEDADAPWEPEAVTTRGRTEETPRIACAWPERTFESAPPTVVVDRFVAPDDVDVVVEHRYFGVTRIVRLPPKARFAEFRVGPAYPVRWTAPHFPVWIEFELSFTGIAGGETAYESDDDLQPGRSAFATGEVRLPPGRYLARLRGRDSDTEYEPLTFEFQRHVEVVAGENAVVEFGR